MNLARKTRLTLGLATVALWSRTALPARAAVGGGTADTPAVAVDSGSGPEAAGELAGFGAFLEQHSVIEGRLREDPALLQDPAFRRNHPTIARYLARHPEITVQLAARPRWFLHRELARQFGPAITRAQLAEFDRFLDQHPALEKLLIQHPQLLRQSDFLNKYPELRDHLRRNFGVERGNGLRPERPSKAERKGQ
jgi:hypothetical protein